MDLRSKNNNRITCINVESQTSGTVLSISSDGSSTFRESPRELRNKAEKQRRDKLNQSIAELASMVPPVVASNKKIDKTGVLRLTAHYLRAHQYGTSYLSIT